MPAVALSALKCLEAFKLWLALRSWCLFAVYLSCNGNYGPDIVWLNRAPPITKMNAGTTFQGCIVAKQRGSGDSLQNHTEIWARALLLSSSLEVSLTSWVHEHFTSYLPRFLGPTDLLLRLSLADISQVILGKSQVLIGNRKRYRRSLKASQTLWDTTQKYERSYLSYKTAVFVCIWKICLIL